MIKQFCDSCEREITSKDIFYSINTIKQTPICDCQKGKGLYNLPCESADNYKNYVIHEHCFNRIMANIDNNVKQAV
jgi:hypothetical protein